MRLAPKAKLLLMDGIVQMTISSKSNENALRSAAVRLYGAYDGDPNPHVKGCVGMLIKAIVPDLEKLDYTEFMQGSRTVSLAKLRSAPAAAAPNPDGFLAKVVRDRSGKLGG